MRIHDRRRRWQTIIGNVMIGDDHIHAQLARQLHLIRCRRACVYCDQDLGAGFMQLTDGIDRQTVTFTLAFGQVVTAFNP